MSEKVYGYKGMNADMTCRGMKFAVGERYHVNGEISLCSNGLHFCERLTDVFNFYEKDGNRFFIVIASGTIRSDGKKSVTSDLEIVRELNEIEINRTAYSYGNSYGNSYGDGNGYGNGYGYGDGNGYGNGYGYGDGNGYGNGYGYGDGYGDGYGYGYGIQRILLFV